MTPPSCSTILFLATPAEEEGLKEVARSRGLPFGKRFRFLGEELHDLGVIGSETVLVTRPVRTGGQLVMGSIGHLGSAARAIRLREATNAISIVQLGMGFGVDPRTQRLGDVLVSTSLLPYDDRIVRASGAGWLRRWFGAAGYVTDYSPAVRHPAQPHLVDLLRREAVRTNRLYSLHFGTVLSGSARIHSSRFRDELVRELSSVPEPIVGGDMEGVGLLAASNSFAEPAWTVVKGISDFGDENRDRVIREGRVAACRNAAEFLLSALEHSTPAG